jgi:hypothetical protein
MKIISTKNYGADRLKCLVFGSSGAGKTTLISTAEEPVLIISFESGLLSIAGKDIDVIDATTDDAGNLLPKGDRINRLKEVYQFLLTEDARAKYKWIAIDSLTELAQNIIEDLHTKFTDRKDGFVMWGEYAKEIKGIIKAFRDLPYYSVIFTALATEDKDESARRYYKINVQGKISEELPAYFDEVFYLFVKDNDDGTSTRKLLCKAHAAVPFAKDRSGKLSEFEEPNLTTIAHKIKGVQNV